MSARRDPRVWHEGMRATTVGGVVAIQNLDRHRPTPERRRKLAEYRAKYVAEAPVRRAANPTVVCRRCWQPKRADGSDGGGGFTPKNDTKTGWMAVCRRCRAEARRTQAAEGQV